MNLLFVRAENCLSKAEFIKWEWHKYCIIFYYWKEQIWSGSSSAPFERPNGLKFFHIQFFRRNKLFGRDLIDISTTTKNSLWFWGGLMVFAFTFTHLNIKLKLCNRAISSYKLKKNSFQNLFGTFLSSTQIFNIRLVKMWIWIVIMSTSSIIKIIVVFFYDDAPHNLNIYIYINCILRQAF